MINCHKCKKDLFTVEEALTLKGATWLHKCERCDIHLCRPCDDKDAFLNYYDINDVFVYRCPKCNTKKRKLSKKPQEA